MSINDTINEIRSIEDDIETLVEQLHHVKQLRHQAAKARQHIENRDELYNEIQT